LTSFKDSLSYAFGIEYANSIYANQNMKQSLDKEMAIKGSYESSKIAGILNTIKNIISIA
jgi:hypothetical protein